MSTHTPPVASIQQILGEETRALRAFFSLLERERRFLEDGSVDPLLPLSEEKTLALARLNALGQRRASWLAAAGYGNGRDGAKAWLTGLDVQAPERDAWSELIDAAERVRDLNDANGVLMRARMQHNQQALAVLLAASDRASLYGPDGQARAGPGKRHFGVA